MSTQTLYSISSNIDSILQNIDILSKLILSNSDIQDNLEVAATSNDISARRRVDSYLNEFAQTTPLISSIYIFDNQGNKYAVDKSSLKYLNDNSIKEAVWYNDVVRKKGAYIFTLNAGGIFKNNVQENYVSMIRVINDINTQVPIGVLIINISEKAFKAAYKEIINQYDTNIVILDERGEYIVNSGNPKETFMKDFFTGTDNNETFTQMKKVGTNEYLFSYLRMDKYNWKIISAIPFTDVASESKIFGFITFLIIIINSVLIFTGSLFITRLITTPVKKLLKSMKQVEKGEFKKVIIQSGNDEIGKLRDGYNIMISEIERLIGDVIDEQRIKRKAELNVLQAQIKPHFLYNTIDTLGYLAISQGCNNVYEGLEALGSYYRSSLSKGSEIVTIREEIEIVRNYMYLQRLRYGDEFSISYDIDDETYDYLTLKLILQPLVENSLYHGIKTKGSKGSIKVSSKIENPYIKLSIEDDGIGMSEDELNSILDKNLDKNKKSFGLRGTIERLRIYYGTQDIYSIMSRKGDGTKVTIRIPMRKSDGNE